MEMAEELDELVLKMANHRVLQQLLGILGLQAYISDMDARDGDSHLVLEHREDHRQEYLTIALANGLYLTIATLHRAADNGHHVTLVDLIGRFAINYLEVITFDDCLKAFHLGIANLDGDAILVAIGEEPIT